ncbi:MAG: hypothetical protein K0R14_949 [Burkholderiales bacterium]|jgi:cell shape-determining protein MreD|nr:hypothetical protein [Burkholderiales bacterium]
MQIKYLNLSILIVIILTLQLIANNTTVLYLDCLTLILITLLLDGFFPVRFILVVCLMADLFGHWCLGTHLLAITLVSFLTKGLVNFYRVSNILQQIVLSGIFALVAYGIIGAVDFLMHRSSMGWINLLIELVVLNPLILLSSTTFIIKLPSDIMRTE